MTRFPPLTPEQTREAAALVDQLTAAEAAVGKAREAGDLVRLSAEADRIRDELVEHFPQVGLPATEPLPRRG